jgi:hypothetical protein
MAAQPSTEVIASAAKAGLARPAAPAPPQKTTPLLKAPKPAASPQPTAQQNTTTPARKTEAPKPVPSTQAPNPAGKAKAQRPAPLDLTSLEQRIRETKAIGALTKITLKNQVDDLLDRFRKYYQGKLTTDLAALRRSYDLLVLKFVSLLQDDDPPLATAIVASREEIWALLADRTRFATL